MTDDDFRNALPVGQERQGSCTDSAGSTGGVCLTAGALCPGLGDRSDGKTGWPGVRNKVAAMARKALMNAVDRAAMFLAPPAGQARRLS